jgi:hypothetical protein
MGDAALQGHQRRQVVDMRRIGCADLRRLKPEVIVAMRLLRLAARMDQVHLRRHLVVRPEPRLAGRVDGRCCEVADEDLRRLQRELLKRVPDTVVAAGCREVIGSAAILCLLALYDAFVHAGRCVDCAMVRAGALHHEDAGPVLQDPRPFGQQLISRNGRCDMAGEGFRVVNRDVLGRIIGKGDVARRNRLRRQAGEFLDAAGLRRVVAGFIHRAHILHRHLLPIGMQRHYARMALANAPNDIKNASIVVELPPLDMPK